MNVLPAIISTPPVTWRKRPVSLPLLAAVISMLFSSTGLAAESMHADIDKYEGTKTCLECHDTLGKEVAQSLHYQLQGEPQNIEGWEKGKKVGMLVSFSPAANTTAGHNWLTLLEVKGKEPQAEGCGRCHIGLGGKPNPPDKLSEVDYQNIDCLICHAPDYQRTVVKELRKDQMKIRNGDKFDYRMAPAPGIDVLKAVRGVKKPTAEMCLRCHGMGGCGNPQDGMAISAENDLHTSMGMNCIECHTTKQHRIAGSGSLKARELADIKVACDTCHTLAPHKGEQADFLNRHVMRIACQTCHIPAVARDVKLPTLVERDWTKPVLDQKIAAYLPSSKSAAAVRPEYLWWNGSFQDTLEPAGGKRDQKSKIYPWKRTRFTLIADSATGKPVPIKSSVYALSGDPAAAAVKGGVEAGQKYSGEWKGGQDATLKAVNHQVAPKAESLQCDACHSENTILDFKALGMKSPRRK